jgi:hypothetical protein
MEKWSRNEGRDRKRKKELRARQEGMKGMKK